MSKAPSRALPKTKLGWGERIHPGFFPHAAKGTKKIYPETPFAAFSDEGLREPALWRFFAWPATASPLAHALGSMFIGCKERFPPEKLLNDRKDYHFEQFSD